jgi:L-malate glycosyltransferase
MNIAVVGPILTENIVAFLNDDHGNLPLGYSGAPLMSTLIGELLKRGHHVSAFTTSPGIGLGDQNLVTAAGKNFRITYCGERPHAFRPKHGYLGRANDFFALERSCLQKAVVRAGPDVVHAHWSYEFGLAAIETGLPHVITCHDVPHLVLKYMPNLYRFMRYWMARQCLAKASVVTAVSPYLQAEIQSYCSASVNVVPNPLPVAVFAEEEHRDGFSQTNRNPIVVMVMNGWGKLKNPKPALQAFHILRSKIPTAELHLYGIDYGPGEQAELWARNKGISDGISFIGKTLHKILFQKLRNADILLHPSLLEGCPMGIAEAMALGLPVVGGASSGGVPWVVGNGGILTDVTSPSAMATALYDILVNKNSYAHYAHDASVRAQQLFSVEAVTDLYEIEYRRALGNFQS